MSDWLNKVEQLNERVSYSILYPSDYMQISVQNEAIYQAITNPSAFHMRLLRVHPLLICQFQSCLQLQRTEEVPKWCHDISHLATKSKNNTEPPNSRFTHTDVCLLSGTTVSTFTTFLCITQVRFRAPAVTTYSSCLPHTFPTTNRLLSSQVNISGFLADLSQRLASGLLLWKVDTHTSSFWFMMNQCSSTSCLPHLSYEMDPKWHIQGSFLPLTHVL